MKFLKTENIDRPNRANWAMHIRHLSRVLGTRSSRKTLGVYLSTFFVIEAHRGDKLYLLGCHPIKGSLHSTAYTAPGLVLPSRVNTLRIYSGGTCFSVSIIPLQVWLVLISMSRFWATCCNIRNQMVFGYQIYRVSIRFHAIQTNTVIFGILFLTRYRNFVTRRNYTSYWVNLTPWL